MICYLYVEHFGLKEFEYTFEDDWYKVSIPGRKNKSILNEENFLKNYSTTKDQALLLYYIEESSFLGDIESAARKKLEDCKKQRQKLGLKVDVDRLRDLYPEEFI